MSGPQGADASTCGVCRNEGVAIAITSSDVIGVGGGWDLNSDPRELDAVLREPTALGPLGISGLVCLITGEMEFIPPLSELILSTSADEVEGGNKEGESRQ